MSRWVNVCRAVALLGPFQASTFPSSQQPQSSNPSITYDQTDQVKLSQTRTRH